MSRPSISFDRRKDGTTDGVLYVARLSALSLTGITVDTTKDARVRKDKEQPPPPDQMRAVLAVMRDTQRHGVSCRSKRLQKTKDKDGQQICRHHRLIAVWNKRKSNHGDESVSFEAKLCLGSQTDHNFDLIIGLTSGSSSTITPVGTAILPMAEAVRMQNALGAVVLDLPVFNFTSLSVNPFAKPQRNSIVPFNRVLSARRVTSGRKPEKGKAFGQRHKKKALGHDYFIDPSGGAALLRIELEVHEKEQNFEVGLDADEQAKKEKFVKHSMESSQSKSHPDNIQVMEPSIERVFTPVMQRRCKALVNDGTNTAVETTAEKTTTLDETFDSDVREDEDEAKVWDLDAAIERVLSVRHMEESTSSQPVSGTKLVQTLVQKPPRPFSRRREKSRRFTLLSPIASEQPLKPITPLRSSPFGRFRGIGRNRVPNGERQWNEISEMKPNLDNENPCGSVDEVVSSVEGRSQQLTAEADCSKSVVSSASTNLSVVKWVAQQKQPLQQHPKSAVLSVASSSNTTPIKIKKTFQTPKHDEERSGSPQRVGGLRPSSDSLTESQGNDKSHASSATVVTKTSEIQSVSSSKFVPFLPQQIPDDAPSVALSKDESALNMNGENWKVEAIVDYFPNQPSDTQGSRAVTPPVQSLPSILPPTPPLVSNDVSRYSTSLPNFSDDEQPVVIIKEKYEDTSVVAEKNIIARESQTTGITYHERVESTSRSLRNYLSLVDIQPCVGKLDGVLHDIDGEDDTVADSWTANDTSTVQTNKPRVVSLRDDLADFGLFLGELCRPIDARTTDENSLDETETYQDETNETKLNFWGDGGVKQRWMSAMNIAQFLDADDQDTYHTISEGASWAEGTVNDGGESFQSASQSIFSFEPTVDSFAMDETVVSEQGTEVDVKDFKLDVSDIELPISKGDTIVRSKSFSEVIKQPFFLRRSPSADPQPTCKEPSLRNHHSPSAGLPKSLWKKSQAITRLPTPTNDIVPPTSIVTSFFPTVELPGKESSMRKRIERISIRPAVESSGGTDIRTPNDGEAQIPIASESNLKSLARSLADLMEYAIPTLPSAPVMPHPSSAPIMVLPSRMAQVPSLLEPDDATSVGDLTATTYEMQVDIDELRRQIEQNEQRFIKPIGRRPFGGHVTQTDNYFSDYDREHEGASFDLHDAMEASLAKQLAEGWSGIPSKR